MKKLILVAFVMLSFACGHRLESIPDWKDMGGGIKTSKDVQQVTKNGVKVYGKVEVPEVYLDGLDRGFDKLKSDVTGLSITERIQTPAIHEVYTTPFPCEPSPVSHTLSWRLRADGYDGSEFDYSYKKAYDPPVQVERTNWDGSKWMQTLYSEPDGVGGIYAAEQVINVGTPNSQPPVPSVYLCVNDNDISVKYRYGLEHIWLLNSDDVVVRDYGQDNLYHWRYVHPLIPMQTNLTSLQDPKAKKFLKEATAGEIILGDTILKKENGVTSITVLAK